MLAGRERHGSPSPLQSPAYPFSRLKPIQKMEGMTNGVAVGPQQATGLSDISAQVQQYQQFLGEGSLDSGAGPGQGLWSPESVQMAHLSSRNLFAPSAHGGTSAR